jgi:predicted PurR-regulated permease PerM
VLGATLVRRAERSGEQFYYTADIGWMTLNPVAIFLSFLFWGVPGMLLAVPILSTIKIFCDRVDSLTRFGEFLGV